ncbi:MAG: S8 family serine peptidase [Deltaproteobacteria bacterium]|nr:S8 family serine peptidase [Deltaproteobacteria bacterium]
MSRRIAWVPALVLLAVAPSTADAQSRKPTRVQPSVLRAIETGVTHPAALRAMVPRPGHAPVIIELDRPATPALLESLRASGATLRKVQGRTLSYSRFVPAEVDSAALAHVQTLSHVARISMAPVPGPRPMDVSGKLLGLEGARGARPALDLLTGQGMVVADLDANAEVFHPMFFRADAGYFDWIDVNGNGKFDVEVDAIDLDRDGKAGPGEIAKWQKTQTLYPWYGNPAPARSKEFDPAIDWVYLDQNDNKKRDYGSKDGFDDKTPALGEPLFVPDDFNKNGALDVGERVARLGSSKFKKVYVHIEYYIDPAIDHVFERGVDLADHKNNFMDGLFGTEEAEHGSAVLSIIVGDVPLVGRRWVGVAPDADVILGYELGTTTSGALTWALGESPQVMLHETANWFGQPLDGTDSYSTIVDASTTQDNVSHSCPVGNLGGARKHAHVTVPAGETKTLSFTMPSFNQQGGPATFLETSFNVRGAPAVGIKIKEPGGQSYDFSKAASGTISTGASYYGSVETSKKGTYFVDVWFQAPDKSKAPPIGTWTVEITGDATKSATVDGYLFDEISSWGVGAAWDASIATDSSTIGIPAVSEHCIAIGATTAHPSTPSEKWFVSGDNGEAQNVLRTYSGRGPRIDGAVRPDIVSPDNPWSAAPFIVGGTYGDTPYGGMWAVGGTSCAGPHVAGVAALLSQAGIRGNAVRDAMKKGAIQDSHTGTTPNMDYGYGRLSAAGALGVKADGTPPTISLVAHPAGGDKGASIVLEPTAADADGPSSALEVKWDDGYDGTWETSYGAVQSRTVTKTTSQPEPFKVRVRDGEGRIAEAVVWVGPPGAVEPDASVSDSGEPDATDFPALPPAGGGDDGCGCRTRPGTSPGAVAFGALAMAVLMMRRRRAARGR